MNLHHLATMNLCCASTTSALNYLILFIKTPIFLLSHYNNFIYLCSAQCALYRTTYRGWDAIRHILPSKICHCLSIIKPPFKFAHIKFFLQSQSQKIYISTWIRAAFGQSAVWRVMFSTVSANCWLSASAFSTLHWNSPAARMSVTGIIVKDVILKCQVLTLQTKTEKYIVA